MHTHRSTKLAGVLDRHGVPRLNHGYEPDRGGRDACRNCQGSGTFVDPFVDDDPPEPCELPQRRAWEGIDATP